MSNKEHGAQDSSAPSAHYSVSDLREIADLFESKGFTRLEICDGDAKVLLEKNAAPREGSHQGAFQAPVHADGQNVPADTSIRAGSAGHEPSGDGSRAQAGTSVPEQVAEKNASTTKAGDTVNSPLVGVFYSSAKPGAKPFVEVGSAVKKGDVLCILEAMKLMNEITAEASGTITEVLAEDGAVVEFGQPLFRIA